MPKRVDPVSVSTGEDAEGVARPSAPVPAPRTPEHSGTDARSWWGAGFSVTRRGYDPGEVEAAFDRAAADYTVVVADRDELARGELRARERIAELVAEVRDLHAAPIDGENLSVRLRHMLALAQEEAAEVRAHAHTAATASVEAGRAQARALHDDAVAWARRTREETDGATRRRLAEASEQATAIVVEAERQAAKLRRESEDERAETVRLREASEAAARELVAAAEAEVARLAQDAATERARLDDAAHERRTQAEHDFETAMTARRTAADAAREATEEDRREAEETARRAQEAAASRLAATTASTEALEAHQREITARIGAVRELLGQVPSAGPDRPSPTS